MESLKGNWEVLRVEQEPKWLLSGEAEFGCLVGVLFRVKESLSQAATAAAACPSGQ